MAGEPFSGDGQRGGNVPRAGALGGPPDGARDGVFPDDRPLGGGDWWLAEDFEEPWPDYDVMLARDAGPADGREEGLKGDPDTGPADGAESSRAEDRAAGPEGGPDAGGAADRPDGAAEGGPVPGPAEAGPVDGAAASPECVPECVSEGVPGDGPAVSPKGVLGGGLDAGFLSRDPVPGRPPRSGFSSGGGCDTAVPGPALAGSLQAAAGGGHAGLDDDELIGVLAGWAKTEAWAAAGRLAAAAELAARRPAGTRAAAAARAGRPAVWSRYCADELAVALSISRRSAERMIPLAHDLATRLPRTRHALAEGIIGDYKAQLIAEATRVLDDAAAADAEAAVVPGAVTGKTPGQIRAAIGRAALKADPGAAGKRRRDAEKDPRVELWREDAGTAAICGYGLPPDAALAADQAITAAAQALKAAGLPGTMDQLRARAYLDALLGMDSRPIHPHTPGTKVPGGAGAPGAAAPGGAGARGGAEPAGAEPAADAEPPGAEAGGAEAPGAEPGGAEARETKPADAEAPGAEPGGPGAPGAEPGSAEAGGAAADSARPQGPARQAGPPPPAAAINLTIPLTTLLGLTGNPGEAAGFGPIDAGLARTMAAQAAASPHTTWCITVTDQHGHPTAHGCATPSRPGKPARTKNPRRRPPGSGTGSGTGSGPPGPRPGTGSAPPGTGTGSPRTGSGPPRPGTGNAPPGTGGPPGGYGTWRLQLPGGGPALTARPEPLAVTGCDHRHETAAHDPGTALRHLVQIRDGHCTYPPCLREARRCDFEHTIPWQTGGRTCACNTGPRCRHHHHVKQAPGWTLQQNQPGYHTWTTPAGRRYTTGPITYPI